MKLKKRRRALLAFQCSSFLLARVGSFLNSVLLDLLRRNPPAYEEISQFKTTKPPTSFSLSLSTPPLIRAYICIWYCAYFFDCNTILILVIDPVSDLVLLILILSPCLCFVRCSGALSRHPQLAKHSISSHSLNSMLCCAVY